MRRFDLIDEFTSLYVPIQHRKVAEMPNDETSVSERRNIRTDGVRRGLLFVGLSALLATAGRAQLYR